MRRIMWMTIVALLLAVPAIARPLEAPRDRSDEFQAPRHGDRSDEVQSPRGVDEAQTPR